MLGSGVMTLAEPKTVEVEVKSRQNRIFSKDENNSVYYTIRAIKLFLRFDRNNLSIDDLFPSELFSFSESNLEQVGKILSTKGLRKMAWYFLDNGAATASILQNRLELSESSTYRYMKDLKNYNFIVRAIQSRKTRDSKGGPRSDLWMVKGPSKDKMVDQINEAQKLHWQLMSPKYVAGETLGQQILEEYMLPRGLKELSKMEFYRLCNERRAGRDVRNFAYTYLISQGMKVWM